MKINATSILIGIVVLSIGLIFWSKINQAKELSSPDSNIISMKGVHFHPELKIFVKGEPVEIPENVGIGAAHQPIHTHDDAPIVHLEYENRVTKEDTRLGKFFTIWGKDFKSFGENVTMTVNGEPNTEFENYEMKDKDVIELRYE